MPKPKENIKLGIAFVPLDWKQIIHALEFKARRAKELGIITFAEADQEIADYIKMQLKKLN